MARSGPRRGAADCEAAFAARADALAFLIRQHGLDATEAKQLAAEGMLELRRDWHGSDRCEILPETMGPARARRALTGELYLRPEELVTPARRTNLTLKKRFRRSETSSSGRA